MILDSTVYLEHYGKRGMHWGQRKARRQANKQARFAANQQKAQALMSEAIKNPNILILLNRNTVVTGKEFMDHLVQGGLLDVSTSRIYARQTGKNGPYALA